MAITIAPFPLRTSVTRQDVQNNLLTRPWIAWLTELVQKVDKDAPLVSEVSLTGKSASISATTFTRAIDASGVYRIGYFARITTAATTSSSLTVTMGGTNGGVVCAVAGAALTGNTTSTVQSGTIYLQVDASTNITYTTTYASSGGTAMVYSLWMTVERVTS
jgi:hypothetical protein